MHIAYLIPTIDRIGGAERQLLLLAKGMAGRGCRATVIALSGSGGSAADELSANDVSFLSLQMRKGIADLRGWSRLRRWIASAKPDILHAHLPHATLMARCIRLAAPLRVLIETTHSPAIGPLKRRFAHRFTASLPNSVTAVSHSAAAPWLQAQMLRASQLSVIPNGIDTNHWKRNGATCTPHSQPASSPRFHWLSVGRLDPVKDHATLLRAFALLPGSAHLTIAGAGPLESALIRLASELGVGERVSLVGFLNDLRPLMHQSDAFVLSSRWEGLPLALMEASACELPSVFTSTPGSRELLPGPPFLSAPIADPSALARKMRTLMDLPESERRRLGTLARQRIVAHFSLGLTLNRFEVLYSQLLASNKQPTTRPQFDSRRQAPFCSSTREI